MRGWGFGFLCFEGGGNGKSGLLGFRERRRLGVLVFGFLGSLIVWFFLFVAVEGLD